jgi:hypothetical protein
VETHGIGAFHIPVGKRSTASLTCRQAHGLPSTADVCVNLGLTFRRVCFSKSACLRQRMRETLLRVCHPWPVWAVSTYRCSPGIGGRIRVLKGMASSQAIISAALSARR